MFALATKRDEKSGSSKRTHLEGAVFDVAIIGGGLVGAVAALSFNKFAGADFSTLVLERGELLNEERGFGRNRGRAYALSESSRVLLDMLGLWEEMAPFAQPIVEIDITDSALDSPLRPVFLSFHGEIEMGKPGAYIIEHEHLAGPIYRALETGARITVCEGCAVQAFKAGASDVAITVAGGVCRAGLLIGADGRGSFVREQAGIKTTFADYDQDGIVVSVALSRAHEGKAVQHFLPAGPFAILPLVGDERHKDRASLVWSEKRGLAADMCALSDEAFEQEVNKRFSPKLGTVKVAGRRAHFPLSLLVANSFIGPRVALVGDAAHGVHPLAGQGMNIGLRDVAALVETVVETKRLGLDFGNEIALERYQQWRRFDGVMSAFAMDGLNRLFSNDQSLLRELRGFGLRLVDRVPPLKDFFVKEAAGVNGDVPLLMQGKWLG